RGKVYPIGLRGGTVYGMRIYESVDDIEDKIDLAVFLIPAKTIPAHLEKCGMKGIQRIVISSGGFSEFGQDRKKLEEEILGIAKRYGMRIIGPNGLAVINNEIGLCLPFVRLTHFPLGEVSLMTQSGGMGLSFISLFTSENIGLNKYVSLGNKLDVGEAELAPFLEQDEGTKIICLYLEEINRGQEFLKVMKEVRKPVVIYKANTTKEGARAAQSHTAAIANDDKVVDAALRQARVIRVSDMGKMVPAAKALKLPKMSGNRVAVMSPTGGYAVILADQCEKFGFTLPPFPEKFLKDISSHVRAGVIHLDNPLDLGDLFDMEMIALTITRAMQEEDFDALVLGWMFIRDSGMVMSGGINVFPFLEKMVHEYQKPIVLCLVGDPYDLSRVKKRTTLPIFNTPEEAVEALSVLYRFSRWSEETVETPDVYTFDYESVKKTLDKAKKDGRQTLSSLEAFEVLAAAGLHHAGIKTAATPESAAAAAAELGLPVAVKINSQDFLHKTEIGGVRLNLINIREVEGAAEEIIKDARMKFPEARIEGVIVQKMAHSGREVIVGAKRDDSFGALVLFGLGGIFVEALGDVSLRVAPLTRRDAEEMLDEIKGSAVLGEFRGMRRADRNVLIDMILRVSSLMTSCSEIRELDLNPVVVYEENNGCLAVDARIIL
ncbi:MAG: acetate--CoA ligase family protein, partial [bacterium]